MTKTKEPDPPPPLCAFCSAPWTPDMVTLQNDYADIEYGYYDSVDAITADFTIDIHCSTCKRLVYRKEIRQHGVR